MRTTNNSCPSTMAADVAHTSRCVVGEVMPFPFDVIVLAVQAHIDVS